ncbi:hypothetical protein K2F54_05330 [Cryobacterium sp. 1639]|uniref:hypothetical protein n=1 Tax=Cryobacterium inferilacus TaxID=2866629 RepID=UPI001C73CB5A|nr:hypothetical protein [Cryobacterium sp. 1639]MBX0299398.1 hypothetical protein [Cryobacterium sp. 1639]
MKIKFIRIIGARATKPGVVATVDDHLVKWNPSKDWECDCLTDLDEFECDHIEAIRGLLDDRVLTPLRRRGLIL